MDFLMLLDYFSSLSEEDKAKAMDEEFNRQRTIVDAMCDVKRSVLKHKEA